MNPEPNPTPGGEPGPSGEPTPLHGSLPAIPRVQMTRYSRHDALIAIRESLFQNWTISEDRAQLRVADTTLTFFAPCSAQPDGRLEARTPHGSFELLAGDRAYTEFQQRVQTRLLTYSLQMEPTARARFTLLVVETFTKMPRTWQAVEAGSTGPRPVLHEDGDITYAQRNFMEYNQVRSALGAGFVAEMVAISRFGTRTPEDMGRDDVPPPRIPGPYREDHVSLCIHFTPLLRLAEVLRVPFPSLRMNGDRGEEANVRRIWEHSRAGSAVLRVFPASPHT